MISIHDNIADIKRSLNDFERKELPFISVLTVTDVAYDIRKDLQQEMSRKFDRPTPFVLNSTFVDKATKARPVAFVQFKAGPAGTRGDKIIRPHVFGGIRDFKKHERLLQAQGLLLSGESAVPGEGAKLDKYGNMRASDINRILSALKAQRDPYQNRTARSAKRAKAAGRFRAFFVPSRTSSSLKPGVYERTKNGIKPIIRFVSKASYRKRLAWHETAEQTAAQVARAHFAARFRQVIGRSFGRAA